MQKHVPRIVGAVVAVAATATALSFYVGRAPIPKLVVADQALGSGRVSIGSVVVPVDGFVVLRPVTDKGEPDSAVALAYTAVKQGETSAVSVQLPTDVKPGARLYAVLHSDTGVKGKFEHGPAAATLDPPIMAEGKPVGAQFVVR